MVVSSLDARHFDEQRTEYVPAATSEPCLDQDDLDQAWLHHFLEDFAALRVVVERCGALASCMPVLRMPMHAMERSDTCCSRS